MCVCVRACVCVCVYIYILYMYRKYCLLYFISTKPIFLTDNERKQIEMCWTLTKTQGMFLLGFHLNVNLYVSQVGRL